MRTVLIAVGEEPLPLDEWNRRKDYWTGIGAFAITFQGDILKTQDIKSGMLDDYDLVIANLDRSHLPKLLHLQESRKPSVKWVSLIERCATDYLPANPVLKQILDGSDLVNVINKHTTEFFRALTTARCEYIGIPFPAEAIRARFFVAPEKRENRIMLPPYVDPPGIVHNASYLAAKESMLPMYGAQRNNFNYGDPNYHSFGYKAPLEYLSFVANSYAFMNLDHRYTWGRSVLECAALGIPCIATHSTGHAERFFPHTSINNEFNIQEARGVLEELIEDPEFYEMCSQINDIPIELFDNYTHESIHKKIVKFLWDSAQ